MDNREWAERACIIALRLDGGLDLCQEETTQLEALFAEHEKQVREDIAKEESRIEAGDIKLLKAKLYEMATPVQRERLEEGEEWYE